MAEQQQPLDFATVQSRIAKARTAGYSDAQISEYYSQRAPQDEREMYFRTPGLGAPQQGFWGTAGREAEILGVHAAAPWVGAANALTGGWIGEPSAEFNRLAPPPATRGERWLANAAETAGVAVPVMATAGTGLAALGGAGLAEAGAAALPWALGAAGGAAAPEARRQYLPQLDNTPGVGVLDFGLGTLAGGGFSQIGTGLARQGLEWAGQAIPTGTRAAAAAEAERAAQASAISGPARAASGPPLFPGGRTLGEVSSGNPPTAAPSAPYPANWAPAASSAGGTVSSSRGGMGALIGDGVEWIARDVLGLPPIVAQGIGAGTGWVVGSGGHLIPRASIAGKIGMTAGGLTEKGNQLLTPQTTLPDVNVTAPAPDNQSAAQ